MAVIDNKYFLGMVTNADPEDLKDEYCLELIGHEALQSMLKKTLGGASYFSGIEPPGELGDVLRNACDFISNKIAMGNITGHIEILCHVNSTTGLMTLIAWNGLNAFVALTSLSQFTQSESVYLDYVSSYFNKMIPIGNTLRVICGANDYNSTNLISDAWIGWIDRGMFNNSYIIPPAFYIYKAPVPSDIEDLSFEIDTRKISDTENGEETEFYYRYSLVYDYTQEGMLSKVFGGAKLYENQGAVIYVTLSNASKYKRLTYIKIYRSENKKHGYQLVSTINIASSLGIVSGKDASCIKKIFFNDRIHGGPPYIDEYNFKDSEEYYITIEVGDSEYMTYTEKAQFLFEETGDGHRVFTISNVGIFDESNLHKKVTFWGVYDASYNPISTGDGSSLKFGKRTVYFKTTEELASKISAGDVITFHDGSSHVINSLIYDELGNVSIDVDTDVVNDKYSGFVNKSYAIFKEFQEETAFLKGYDSSLDKVEYTIYDDRLTGISAHPLAGEISTQVNSKYALYHAGRMFKINSILDPIFSAEEQQNLLMYSEYNQPDIMPVSNAIACNDFAGGEAVGLDLLFDSLLIINKHSIHSLYVNNIVDPSTWVLSESPHGIGCVSDKAHIVAGGSLFVVYYDGIYEFTPNNLAESDRTPADSLRISEPINDIFLALSNANKEQVVLRYDKIRNELLVDGLIITGTPYTMCYDLTYKSWRKAYYNSDASSTPMQFYNKQSQLIEWDDGAGNFINVNSSATTATLWKSKVYVHNYEKFEILREMSVTYKSGDALTITVHNAETDAVLFTKTLAVKTAIGTERFSLRIRAKKYYIKIVTSSSTNNVEIHRVKLITDESQK